MSELGKVIVSERQGDSFKSWRRECSSDSQGHRYFMAFTFLHDKLMPRIERVVLGGKSLTTKPLSPTPTYHLCCLLTFTSPCFIYVVRLGVTLLRFSFTSKSERKQSKRLRCRLLFSISSFTHLCFIKSFSISC